MARASGFRGPRRLHDRGKVILLTLARAPWVTEACKNFYGSVGSIINQLHVPIIYAQEGLQVGGARSCFLMAGRWNATTI